MQQWIYEAITHLADQLKNIEGVIGIVLFGSYSRGDYEEGSDIDLLLVLKDKEALITGQEKIYKITAQTDMFLQAIALTLDEVKASTLLDPLLPGRKNIPRNRRGEEALDPHSQAICPSDIQ